MAETTAASVQPLSQRMETLAALEPSPFPVISVYLNLVNQNGREDFRQFLRKALSDRAKGLPSNSSERESFDKDAERIQKHLDNKDNTSSQAIAVFACTGSDLFDVIPLD